MKKMKRWLSSLMCLSILLTSVPGNFAVSIAEETEIIAVDSVEEAGENEILEESLLKVEESGEEVNDLTPEADPLPEADFTEPVCADTEEKEFCFGYAKTVRKAALREKKNSADAAANLPKGSIVFVVERQEDKICVTFALEGEAVSYWMDAEELEPLTEKEVKALQLELDGELCYNDDNDFPLPENEIIFPEDSSESREVDPSGEPESLLPAEADEELNKDILNENRLKSEETPVSDGAEIVIESNSDAQSQTVNPADNAAEGEISAGGEEQGYNSKPTMVSEIEIYQTAVVLCETSDLIEYSSSDIAVAQVSAEGVVTGVGIGSCVIYAKVGDNVTELPLTVYSADEIGEEDSPAVISSVPTRIEIKDPSVLIGVKQVSAPVEYTLFAGNEPTDGEVGFVSSNEKVVKVSEDGKLLGVKAGNAMIRVAAAEGNASALIQVTVKKAPSKLTIDPTDLNMAVGQRKKISYTLTKNTAAGMTFASSDTGVVIVDEVGEICAVGAGNAKIRVSTHNGLTKYCTVSVSNAPENVEMKLSATKLGVGMEATAAAGVDTSSDLEFAYRFWTDEPQVISVDERNGRIKALSEGAAKVYVETYNGVTTHAGPDGRVETFSEVKVVPEPDNVRIDGAEFNLFVGGIITLPVSMTMNDGSTDCMTVCRFATSNKKIAQVNDAGQVKGVKAGTAIIRLTAQSGHVVDVKVNVRAKASKVVLSSDSMTLGLGMKSSLQAKVYYSSKKYFMHGAGDALGIGAFATSDSSVAAVNAATGEITAVGKGTATVGYRTVNGKTAVCKVTVLGEPTKISLNIEHVKLGVGMTCALEPVYQANEMGPVTFSSSDSAVAEVDVMSGAVTAAGMGTAIITADAGNGVAAQCEVKVVPKPDSVCIDGKEFNVFVGGTITLPVSMTMNDGSTDCMTTYRLATSNKKIVQVNDAGQVKGVKAGTAIVRLTAQSGHVVDVKINVRAKASKVVLSSDSMTLGLGMKSNLQARVYYSSKKYFMHTEGDRLGVGAFATSDSSVAAVNAATGEITAVGKGTATVGYRTVNGKSAVCKVTVLAAPTSLRLNAEKLVLAEGMTSAIKAAFNDYEYGALTYACSDESVAKVSASGVVTAVGAGEATITVAAQNGVYAACSVMVVQGPDRIELNITQSNLAIKGQIVLKATATYQGSDNCAAELKFRSSNAKVASVTEDGVVRGIKAGSAIIRVQAQNGVYADCQVVVRKAPEKVMFEKSTVSLGVGQSVSVAAKIGYSGGSCLYSPGDTSYARLSVEDPSIARVDPATGRVEGLEVGFTYLKLTTYNGKTAKCKLAVGPGPEWIELDESALTMSLGQTLQLGCRLSAGSTTEIGYSSSNTGAVRVTASDTGCILKAVGKGKVVITAVSANGKTSACEVTVADAPQKIEFAENSIVIGVNETAALPEVRTVSGGESCSLRASYSISGDAAVLGRDGLITGVRIGTATVTASVYGGASAICTVSVKPEPAKISLIPKQSVLAVGESMKLRVDAEAAGRVVYKSDDETVLSVSGDGIVTAQKVGSTIVRATAYNGVSASCEIRVMAAPEWVRFDIGALTMCEGAQRTLAAAIDPNGHGTLIYQSSDSAVAAVDQSGRISAGMPGCAEIRVHAAGREDIFDICTVSVLKKPDAIELSESTLVLRKGAAAKLKTAFSCESGEECYGEAVFASSDPGVASVDVHGRITAVGEGEAQIVAKLKDDAAVTAACRVIVDDKGVSFDSSMLSMSTGDVCLLRVNVPEGESISSLESSDPDVAAVDPNTHELTALSAGTATITAVSGGKTASCIVRVTDKPTEIVLSAAGKRMPVGGSWALDVRLKPSGSAAMLQYTTSDASVATVSGDGLIQAVGCGEAVVRVMNQDGTLSARCVISAAYEPEMVRFAEVEGIVISVGDSYVLEAPAMYSEKGECYADYTLAVSDENCVSVRAEDGRHIISGVSEGAALLRLKTDNGKTAACKVEVTEKPESIFFEKASICMAEGERYRPAVLGSGGAKVAVTLASSDPGCVKVSEDGMLEALAEGVAVITAVSENYPGLSAAAEVKVGKAPDSIALELQNDVLAVGERTKLAISFGSGPACAQIDYSSSDERVVQVGRNGVAVAVGVGEATVTATAAGGAAASCRIAVKAAPSSLSIIPGEINACIKDTVRLTAAFGSDQEYANLTYRSEDPAVAAVSEEGTVTFGSIGETVIAASAVGGYEVYIPVTVCETPQNVSMSPESGVILSGDTAKLDIAFDVGSAYYTLTSSDESVLKVSADGAVHALRTGRAVITLDVPCLGKRSECTMTVVDALDGISLHAEKNTLELGETVNLICALAPANAIGSGGVTYHSSDESVAAVDSATGVVTGVSYGSAVITAAAADGHTAKCRINVLGGKRRMMVAYYFGETDDPGHLPFAYNNGYSMVQAFSAAKVEGQAYDIVGPMSGAPKSKLLNTIDSHFSDATDSDVSVIYICAHGSANGVNGEYAFMLDENHYVTASELMNRIEKIRGRVVLIMDSCYSGGMIDCNKARLDAQGGRISILASSHRSTSSCYWNVPQKLTSVDFFTHAFLQGIGFNEAQGIGGNRGWFASDAGPADDSGNDDGCTTVSELFSYAKSVTVTNIAGMKKQKQFYGNPAQVPKSYIGNMNKDLVLFAR